MQDFLFLTIKIQASFHLLFENAHPLNTNIVLTPKAIIFSKKCISPCLLFRLVQSMMAFDFPEPCRVGTGTFLSLHGLPIKMSHAYLFLQFPNMYLLDAPISVPSHLNTSCTTHISSYFFKNQMLILRDEVVSTQNKEVRFS